MGFCDCAPDDSKELQVLFLYKRVPYMAVVSDQVCTFVALKQFAVRGLLTQLQDVIHKQGLTERA